MIKLHLPPWLTMTLTAAFAGLMAVGKNLPPGRAQNVVMTLAAMTGGVAALLGLPPGAQTKPDGKGLEIPGDKGPPPAALILVGLGLAAACAHALPGCAHVAAGGAALEQCEIGKLPSDLQAVVAKLVQVADEPEDQAIKDMEVTLAGVAPDQIVCLIEAAEALLKPTLARSRGQDYQTARSIHNLEVLKDKRTTAQSHARGVCQPEFFGVFFGQTVWMDACPNPTTRALVCDRDGKRCEPYTGGWCTTTPCEEPVRSPPTVGL